MVQINAGQREVSCKLVYYGPGMSGKTTNLEIIHQRAPEQARGEMVSIATEKDRTLYFDFLPLDLGQVGGMHTKFQLYTVPGQIYYNATRKLVLQGVDGVIFVADSDPDKMAENLESMENLADNLAEMNLNIEDLPLVIQYNKRDLPGALPVAELEAKINPRGVPHFEAVARDGTGVFPTLKELSKVVIDHLNKQHLGGAPRRRTSANKPATAPKAMPGTPAAQSAPTQPMPQQAANPVQAAARAATNIDEGTATEELPAQGSPKDKHLNKAKPAPLGSRSKDSGDVGTTESNLRRYRDDKSSRGSAAKEKKGGVVNGLLVVVLLLVAAVLVLVIVLVVSPDLRAQLGFGEAPTTPTPTEEAAE